MQKIPLKLAEPGFKLARAVERDDGITVVAEGVELTQVLIDRLGSMDIERVVVQGSPLDLGDAGGSTAYGVRLERLDHLFRGFDNNQWMQKVKAFMGGYFELKAAAQAAEDAAEDAAEEAAENAAKAAKADAMNEEGEGVVPSQEEA